MPRRFYMALVHKNRLRNFFFCGICLFISEFLKQLLLTFAVNGGNYYWWYFPFQLCSIPMYLMLLLPFVGPKTQEIFLLFLSTFGLLGGIAAFADTSGLKYTLPLLTVHSYIWHFLLILSGIYAGCTLSKHIRFHFSLSAFRLNVLVYLSCCFLAECINLSFDSLGTINMFYINPDYPMQQIVFRDIANTLSNPIAILLYISATICGASLLFLLWRYVQKQ
ncbi:YwaF family protein [Faecalicatena acetigenes]|uniref:YwaF family protein n=2 Tax=Faecalicatena acetigenes TaxID=2981790 RepID=A0ABT2T7E9_9FIRM|nr:YwaF family protein [Faecalicatena acetigenes]MCU6746188.1 YwaF family protein [Faecalicatena acetigenes]